MKEVILAKSAGFCFGVQRAMDTVYAEADKKNVYTYGPIIHNTEVVNELESKGVKAVNDISEIQEPEKSTVIIRSHGDCLRVVGFACCECRQYSEPDDVDRLLGCCDDGRLFGVSDGVAYGRSRCG